LLRHGLSPTAGAAAVVAVVDGRGGHVPGWGRTLNAGDAVGGCAWRGGRGGRSRRQQRRWRLRHGLPPTAEAAAVVAVVDGRGGHVPGWGRTPSGGDTVRGCGGGGGGGRCGQAWWLRRAGV